jgi:hypothetical protein
MVWTAIVCWLWCCMLLSRIPACCQAAVSDVVIVNISSPSCVQQGSMALNCSWPSELTIRTAEAITLPRNYVQLLFQWGSFSWQREVSNNGRLDNSDATNTTIIVSYSPRVYEPTVMLAIMNVTVLASYSVPAGPPFTGLSFSYEPPPSLSSISGCEGSGLVTYNCVPHSTVLTLRGSGFHWYYRQSGDSLGIGNSSYWLQPGAIFDTTMIVLNDTTALVPLNRSYIYLLLPYHYNGLVLPIRLAMPKYNMSSGSFKAFATNSLSISFVPLPPPIIRLVTPHSGRQNYCVPANSSDASSPIINCEPLFSTIWIEAWYSYDATITVGGYSCNSQSFYTSRHPGFVCSLPLIPSFVPGLLYNVTMRNYAGSFTVPAAVAFTGLPFVYGMTACEDVGWANSYGGQCLEGQLVIIYGAHLLPDPSLQVLLINAARYGDDSIHVRCLQPTFINSSAVSCVLPSFSNATQASLFIGRSMRVRVVYSSYSSNNFNSVVYIDPQSPVITDVSGCGTSRTVLLATECRSGDVLRLTGERLLGQTSSVLQVRATYDYRRPAICSVLANFTTNSSIQCTLATFNSSVDWWRMDEPLTLQAAVRSEADLASAGGWRYSNVFRIALTLRPNDPLQPTDGEESSDEAAVILPAVVGPVVVLVLLLVAALLWLHRRSRTMTPSLRTEEAVDGGTRKWWRVEDDKSRVELS